jgi:tRNA threonylcarbamoyladenosine biosynthesis protein TsaB
MKLLALDTASGQCSVALFADGQLVMRAVTTAREHAQLLLPMVDAVLAEAGLALRGLDGIAFGRGPGSFTGLRIAAAVTQGLAAGAGLPVLPVSDLRALAEGARVAATNADTAPADGWLLACMDARMGELYWGLFPNGGPPVGVAHCGERLSSPAQLAEDLPALLPGGVAILAAAGMGFAAYPALLAQCGLAAALRFPQAEPHAGEIARLAAFDLAAGAAWLDPLAAQPVYLRDRVVQAPL